MFTGKKPWTGAAAGLVLILSMLACSFSTSNSAVPTARPSTNNTNLPTAIPTSAGVPAAGPSPAAVGTSAVAAPTAPAAVPVTGGNFITSVREVASRVKPAVVQITNLQVQVGNFNQPFTVPAGVGSGVIYDSRATSSPTTT